MDCEKSRVCRRCGEEKAIGLFRVCRGKPTWQCKQCSQRHARRWYEENKDRAREIARASAAEYRKSGKATEYRNRPEVRAKLIERKRIARLTGAPGFKPVKHDAHVKLKERLEREQKWGINGGNTRHARRFRKAARSVMCDAHVRLWRSDNTRMSAWRYRYDAEFNLKQRLRARARKYDLDAYAYKYASVMVKGIKRSRRFEALVGYTVADLRSHLERQFTKGMTWERFLAGEIHIDHITPRSAFDLSDPSNVKECWCLSNLQPLWARDNLRKSNRQVSLL